jgi:tRNA nucleotidyltransferase/poly(A) polymerase
LFPASSSNSGKAFIELLARPDAARLLAALNSDGEEARIVGGAVRDALMGRAVGDIDLATTATPQTVMATAARHGWKAVPTGIAHGTVTLVIDGAAFEVTTLRCDIETDGRHAIVAFSRDFAEDARRRDFTINALSLSPDGELHDYATGIADASAGLVRFMGDPAERIREDYLRILRFFRFHASHGRGEPDAHGLAAATALAPGVAQLSRERIRQEVLKLLAADGAVEAVKTMARIGLWPMILPDSAPDLAALERLQALDVSDQNDPVLRLAVLLSKPEDASRLQEKLALSNRDQQRILVGLAAAGDISLRGLSVDRIARLVHRHGPAAFRDGLLLAAAVQGWTNEQYDEFRVLAAPLIARPPMPPFGSGDVAALGIRPGPRMGHVLKAAAERWLDEGRPTEPARLAAILHQALAATAD